MLPAIQPAGPTEDGSRTLTRALGLKIGRIVIDPGHGGHDTGTLGPTGLEEKDVVLDVGLKLQKTFGREYRLRGGDDPQRRYVHSAGRAHGHRQ